MLRTAVIYRVKGYWWHSNRILERIKDVVTVSLLENDLALKSGTLFYENWAKPNLTGKVTECNRYSRHKNSSYLIARSLATRKMHSRPSTLRRFDYPFSPRPEIANNIEVVNIVCHMDNFIQSLLSILDVAY